MKPLKTLRPICLSLLSAGCDYFSGSNHHGGEGSALNQHDEQSTFLEANSGGSQRELVSAEFRLAENFEDLKQSVENLSYKLHVRESSRGLSAEVVRRNSRVLGEFSRFGNSFNRYSTLKPDKQDPAELLALLEKLVSAESFMKKNGYTEIETVQRAVSKCKLLLAEAIALSGVAPSDANFGSLAIDSIKARTQKMNSIMDNLLLEIRRQKKLTREEEAKGYGKPELEARAHALNEMLFYKSLIADFENHLNQDSNYFVLIEKFQLFGKQTRYIESRDFVYQGLFGPGRAPCGNGSIWDKSYNEGCGPDRSINAIDEHIRVLTLELGGF